MMSQIFPSIWVLYSESVSYICKRVSAIESMQLEYNLLSIRLCRYSLDWLHPIPGSHPSILGHLLPYPVYKVTQPVVILLWPSITHYHDIQLPSHLVAEILQNSVQ